jgi:hypothetical protein
VPFRESCKSAPARLRGVAHAFVPVRTLPLIFQQRKRHLQRHKETAQHRAPYERRDGEGLLALPEDVLVSLDDHVQLTSMVVWYWHKACCMCCKGQACLHLCLNLLHVSAQAV